jgi:two-component system, NarL family, nitrate/nitrite response regulator NarL
MGLRALLDAQADMVVLEEAEDGRQAVDLATALDPDVVVMDIAMPRLNGIDATVLIRAAAPRSQVVVLSAHGEPPFIERVLSLGTIGFVLKRAPVTDLLEAIREARMGRAFVSPCLRLAMSSPSSAKAGSKAAGNERVRGLSPRESEVLQRIAEGRASKQIAADLGLSIKTVEKHRQRLMKKLDLHDIASVVRYALTAGVIQGGVPSESD